MLFAGLMSLLVGAGFAVVPISSSDDPSRLLRMADSIKTSNHAKFAALIKRLNDGTMKLSQEQQFYLRYLSAYQLGYTGEYEAAIPLLDEVISQSSEPTLRFRANVTAVNILVFGRHYEEAFKRLSQLLDQLPSITDKDARAQSLGVASFLYSEAGQYDLAVDYANRFLEESHGIAGDCKGKYLKIEASYRSSKLQADDESYQDGINACVKANEPVFSNLIRFYAANVDVRHDRQVAAIKLLKENYEDAQRTRYPLLISEFDALLAQAYWQQGDIARTHKFALAAIDSSVKNEYTEPLSTAFHLLYLVAQKQGDMEAALAYHERYMAADKGYLNDISAKALAYQTVKQQVLAKKLQIETLSKQNQILTLQQDLGKKAEETSRLYIVVLLMVLAFIAFWAYRIKRSQLRFMKLARRDGLTGIFNRQHFVSEAELQLQYCRKSSRDACLVLVDLDHFKIVNDTHGHAVGDRVLRRAVEACQAHLRSTDIFGRLGGEEFGILLPECTLAQVVARTEQIRIAIATAATGEDAPGIPISASFGVSMTGQSGYDLRQLLIHADDALYRAKREGRNRVSVWDISQPTLRTV
ncbi:GGDEF domain-containing protein [Rhodanobacter sp. T12-5]|nr:GGDEF domain-containing protein [Rhodanobacter sp. T12-5]KAA0070649.1 GGDEF domain-containing protein [Rhodanobacter sp. T12-5]